jgi:hypothetical protein
MTDSNDHRGKAASDEPGPTSWASGTYAPTEVSGLTGASALCLIMGIVSLVLALADARPLITWVLAAIGVVSGLRVFLPRVTILDKVLVSGGVLTSLIAIVVMLVS